MASTSLKPAIEDGTLFFSVALKDQEVPNQLTPELTPGGRNFGLADYPGSGVLFL
jgi:hypothetical protein